MTRADSPTLSTPLLPKPFKRVKSFTSRPFALDDDPGGFQQGTYVVYMDPRGDISFAIGIPANIALFLGPHPTCAHIQEQNGVHFVSATTGEHVAKLVGNVMREYAEAWSKANKREVIVYHFDAVAPLYDDDGSPLPEWAYAPKHTHFGGLAGQKTEISLSFERRWLVGKDLYIVDDEGRLKREHHGSGRNIPYTPETWDELVRVRDTLTRAAVLLGKVFDSDDIPKALVQMRFPALAAPAAADPGCEWPTCGCDPGELCAAAPATARETRKTERTV